MNVEELSMIGPNVDLETVNAINKKRLLAFVNHFVVRTTLFLNKLSKSCEHGLMSLENKIQKLETSIVILESKLNSVPGLNDEETVNVTASPSTEKAKGNSGMDIEAGKADKDSKEVNKDGLESGEDGERKKTELEESLMKYVKMLQFGVPQEAVKLKMEQENVDESLHNVILTYNK